MNTFFFTFGLGHTLVPSYTTIEAECYGAARDKMFVVYGPRWAFQYDSAEEAGVERFNLTLVPFGSHEGFTKDTDNQEQECPDCGKPGCEINH